MKNILKSILNLLAGTAILMGGLISCEEKNVPEPAGLKNMIEYGTEKVTVNTVLYQKEENGNYSIYLTPRRGVKYIENMVAVDDYLFLSLESADGNVESGENWNISYGKLGTGTGEGQTPPERYEIYASLSEQEGTLDLSLKLEYDNGSVLNAEYDGPAAEAGEKPLANQWRSGTEICQIESVVKYMDPQKSVYYIYDTPDQTYIPEDDYSGKYIEINVAEDLDVSDGIDITKTGSSMISIKVGGKDIIAEASEVSGRFRITESGKDMTVSFAIMSDGQRYEADYFGTFVPTYPLDNRLKVTGADGEILAELTPLTKVFGFRFGSSCHIAIGTGTNPQDLGFLKKDRYAFDISITNINMKKGVVGGNDGFTMNLCDNTVPEIIALGGEGSSGYVYSSSDPLGRENHIYLAVDVTFSNGIRIEGQWFGEITICETDFTSEDLIASTPAQEPGAGSIRILATDGETEESNLQVKEVQFRTRKETVDGKACDFCYFYFINSESDPDPDKSDASTGVPTPKLRVLREQLNSGEHSIPDPTPGAWWQLTYRKYGQYKSGIIQSQISAGHQLHSPSDGKYNVELDEQAMTCKISFLVHDTYDVAGGTGKWIELTYDGPLSEYTGNIPPQQ